VIPTAKKVVMKYIALKVALSSFYLIFVGGVAWMMMGFLQGDTLSHWVISMMIATLVVLFAKLILVDGFKTIDFARTEEEEGLLTAIMKHGS
jgi:uncharacterized membrane protein